MLIKVLSVCTIAGCVGGLPAIVSSASSSAQVLSKEEIDGMFPESGDLAGATVVLHWRDWNRGEAERKWMKY